MHATIDRRAGRQHPRLLRLIVILACTVVGLAVGVGAQADTPQGRRPGEPLVVARRMSADERAETRRRVADVARQLGIPGRASTPRRTYQALDLRVVDETTLTDPRGRAIAVVRTDAGTGMLRSVVRLDWSRDADRPRVDRGSAAAAARRQARLAGLTVPATKPLVRWDETMDAWRADWQRRVDGHVVVGEGLTVWVHRGGQLAALRHARSAVATVPAAWVGAAAAEAVARRWAVDHGALATQLTASVAADPVWVHPNDFLIRGGADDTDRVAHLAYRVDLTVPRAGSSVRHLAIFVDVGSGLPIAGVETA